MIKLRMKLEFVPLSIKMSDIDGYGLSILGWGINHHYYAFGFCFYKEKKPECKNIMLVIHFYKYAKRILVNSKKNDHYICNYCGSPVWKHNYYCQKCEEEMMESEVSFIKMNNQYPTI